MYLRLLQKGFSARIWGSEEKQEVYSTKVYFLVLTAVEKNGNNVKVQWQRIILYIMRQFTCTYTAKYENYTPKLYRNKGHFQDTMLILQY